LVLCVNGGKRSGAELKLRGGIFLVVVEKEKEKEK
jgi:hypothetical protein